LILLDNYDIIEKKGGDLMQKTDITQEGLCIQKIISVIKGHIDHQKPITVEGRHSDAFVYVISGSCTYRFDDKIEFEANEGNVFYLPYRSVYTMYIHTSDYKFIFCDFQFAEAEARHGVLYQNQKQKNIDNLFLKLLNSYHASSISARTECMSILYGIYSILQQDAQKSYLGKSKENKVSEAMRSIDESFNRPEFSISSLADQIGVSEVYLRKLFRAQFATSPAKYLISVRLKNAKKLMKYPFLSLEECAMQSGFSSLQYFSRLFKKETGISPGSYRKQL
jgi:AraC-like DNA-binding protein